MHFGSSPLFYPRLFRYNVNMSVITMQEITCPCGEVFEVEIYQSVSVRSNPELKELILAGEFNLVQCPNPQCKKVIFAEKFLLYHDVDQELLAFVYPREMENKLSEIQDSVSQQYKSLREELVGEDRLQYQPFLLFGLDRLCDLIHLEEERADEAAIVSALCETLSLPYKTLKNDYARRKNLPAIAPLGLEMQSENLLRQRVLEGLEIILETNDHLVCYKIFLTQVQSDPNWTLDPAEFVEPS